MGISFDEALQGLQGPLFHRLYCCLPYAIMLPFQVMRFLLQNQVLQGLANSNGPICWGHYSFVGRSYEI